LRLKGSCFLSSSDDSTACVDNLWPALDGAWHIIVGMPDFELIACPACKRLCVLAPLHAQPRVLNQP
jgi:hypothetical protein